jgi:ATP adenylyltransferase
VCVLPGDLFERRGSEKSSGSSVSTRLHIPVQAMDHLWSPWRFKYISGAERQPGCVFCRAKNSPDDKANLIVFRGTSVYVILNLFPYTSGHLMVVPYEHIASFADLDDPATDEMFRVAKRAQRALQQEYKPHGFNIGMNLGEAAGAGVAEHLHLHIVPRWVGDSNFMTVIGETRVLPEELLTTYERLSRRLNASPDVPGV